MHAVPIRFRFPGIIALVITALFASTSTPAQEQKVEYIPTTLSDTLTMLKGQGGNIAISAGEDGVYIIDDQLQPLTDQLLVAISEISDQPIRFVINTHFHHDHVGGNETIGKGGAVIIAHDNIHQRMSSDYYSNFFDNTWPAWPQDALPVITFNDQITLHFNGEIAKVYHVPHGHTDGDSIVHFPASDVIHMGDIYFNGLYPYIDLDGGGNIEGMIAGAELGVSIAGEDTQIIPGHGPLSNKANLAEYRDFLVTARNNVQKLIDQGKNLEEAVAARPTAQWDATLGAVWITPEQLVIFIYNSLKGIAEFTPLNSDDE
ncbi:MAG: MBL fold metallo-hydrolase [Proteobacteria bacterium]|nr:MBL fold metallo-hydrolase [Pseudomonadota bacterium]